MEVAVVPIYFKSPEGPQSREMRQCRDGPVPEPHVHLTQLIPCSPLSLDEVFRDCDFDPKNRRHTEVQWFKENGALRYQAPTTQEQTGRAPPTPPVPASDPLRSWPWAGQDMGVGKSFHPRGPKGRPLDKRQGRTGF